MNVPCSGPRTRREATRQLGGPSAERGEARKKTRLLVASDQLELLMGGPMMGIAQFDLSVPVIKATSGIVCTTDFKQVDPIACIGCGACVRSCPMFLMPTRLARLSLIRHWSDADKMGIMNCIECGSCAYVCPSSIPLVQWIRVGKQKVYELQCDLVV